MDKHADFLFPSYLEEEARGRSTQVLQQQGIDAMFPKRMVPNASLHHRASVGHTKAHYDTKRSMSNRTAKYEKRVQLHATLQPAVHCKLALALDKDAGHCRATEEQRASTANMAGRTFQKHTES